MRSQTSSAILPPPVGGWDTESALADMPDDRAVILDNWFPDTDRAIVRRGSASHATGMSGAVESLIEYVPLTGAASLFAANDGKIYDVTSAGAVGAAVVSGLSNDRWQHVQIGTSGGQFLFMVNGADAARSYDGSSWATPSITGPTVANLIWCNLHQRRLWFGERDSLTFWYLPVNSISGTASSFSLQGVARLGGYIMAMGSWTRDGGDGTDDVAVFLTSEGEAIVYQGTDPSTADTWVLIGVFRVGRPIGRRCMIKAGADLIMMTQDGFVPASRILSVDRSQTEQVALSRQISKAVNDAVRSSGSVYGWQPILYPKAQMLIFNVPQSTTQSYQYVFNTITGAPCRFTGINARCWGLKEDAIYFGGADGKVYAFDIGTTDDGAAIAADGLQAFSDFGSPGRQKSFKRVEPIFQGASDPAPALDLNVDYQIQAPTGVSAPISSPAARWGVSKWGVGTWGSPQQVWRGWRSIRGYGRAASIRVRVSNLDSRTSWLATNFLFVAGGQR